MTFKTGALLLAAVCLAPAQQFRGTLTGRVLDAQEAVVPNVKIVATQVDTGASYDAVTGSEGQYTLPFLAPGVYRVTATVMIINPSAITNAQGAKEANTPPAVATPRPPRKPANTGQTWPVTAASPAMAAR